MDNLDHSELLIAELIESIALHSDQDALNNLLSYRKLFVLEGKRYLFSEFLWKLREKRFAPFIEPIDNDRAVEEKLDMIYDRTLKKFSALKPTSSTLLAEGPFCNNQYLRLHERITQIKEREPNLSKLELDEEIGRVFKNYIITLIYYSWLETCRLTDPFYKRYRWPVAGGYLEIKRPRWIELPAFTKWLEENVENPDVNRNEERKRIQSQIHNHYGYGTILSIDDQNDRNNEISTNIEPLEDIDRLYSHKHLYDFIAEEKANNIMIQRPSIRRLGKGNLKKLVLRVLYEYTEQGYKDIEIAREFKLSKATFSRFAGQWKKKGKTGGSEFVPDLWKNVAQVVNKNSHFTEIAISLGIKEIINMIVKKTK